MARSFIKNNEIMINKVELIPTAPKYKNIIGAVIGIEKNTLVVKTKDSFIKITEYYSNKEIKTGDRFEF